MNGSNRSNQPEKTYVRLFPLGTTAIMFCNNTPQAYGQRKLTTLKLRGYFFLGAE
jgi:hypothetical protein